MNEKCGHTADGNLGPLVCDKPKGHAGLHQQTIRLRDDQVSRTNWGDDGKAPWATTTRFA